MIAVVVQARMSSTRLPGKTLMEIAGEPMLGHVLRRARRIPRVEQVIVATTQNPADAPILQFARENHLPVHIGSEEDVLDRYYQAAKRFGVSVIVRVTPDCPLLDPGIAGRVLEKFLGANGALDYVSNIHPPTYPDGLDTEVFSFDALERAWSEARASSDREHVTPYIWNNPGKFRLDNIRNERDLSALRWTVDESGDLEFVRVVYSRLGKDGRSFGLPDVLRLLGKEPRLAEMNQGIMRNEGYYKSLASESPLSPQPRKLDQSHALMAKARRLIPSCSQTFSKGPTQFVQGVAPSFLVRGQGSHVWDADENEYIDYPMALGPIILGHGYPAVNEAVRRQLEEGISFSLPHPLEVEVAELLVEAIPCAEMVRFGKNGSDATGGAVRVARAFTGREMIACCGYHGWQDWYVGTTTRNKGVPQAVRDLTVAFEYNNLESLERVFAAHPGRVAAVIMEPVGVVEPRDGFLEKVQEACRREGALLAFDEVVTGFRLAVGGAQELYGVVPDLACFGKAMANGFPLSAVVGRREIMEFFDEVFFSFTFGGEALSLAAAKATLLEMRSKPIIQHLWKIGSALKDGYNALAREVGVDRYTECIGLPPRTVVVFRDEDRQESLLYKSLFQQECLKRGILFSGGQNICYSHDQEDVTQTLRAYCAAMRILAEAIERGDAERRLEGKPVEPVFRRA